MLFPKLIFPDSNGLLFVKLAEVVLFVFENIATLSLNLFGFIGLFAIVFLKY